MAKVLFTKKDLGKVVRIINDTSGHGIPMGTTGVAKPYATNQLTLEGYGGCWLYYNEVEVIGAETREIILSSMKTHEQAIELLKAKLSFLDATGSDEYNDNEFKAYHILITLKDTTDEVAKARKIAKLFQS